MRKSFISIIILLSISFTDVFSAEYNIYVSKVTDGDSIHGIYNGKKLKIRLLYIDAPELKQPHGIKAKQFLENMILDKDVTIVCQEKDFYGRELCEVFHYELNTPTYVNAKMIKSGNAWVYKSNRNNNYLINLENDAISNQRGLWSDKNPLEPWVYRRSQK